MAMFNSNLLNDGRAMNIWVHPQTCGMPVEGQKYLTNEADRTRIHATTTCPSLSYQQVGFQQRRWFHAGFCFASHELCYTFGCNLWYGYPHLQKKLGLLGTIQWIYPAMRLELPWLLRVWSSGSGQHPVSIENLRHVCHGDGTLMWKVKRFEQWLRSTTPVGLDDYRGSQTTRYRYSNPRGKSRSTT